MKCDALKAEMTAWRHDFHRHPELGFQEERTAGIVAGLLRSFGLEVQEGIGGTGVVGVLQRGNGEGSIAFRADMDALPLGETGECDHKSTYDGVMHACGHDGHTSMLLGAAKYLAEAGDFNGRAIFIFQPNEKNGFGAKTMIDEGLLTGSAPTQYSPCTTSRVWGLAILPLALLQLQPVRRCSKSPSPRASVMRHCHIWVLCHSCGCRIGDRTPEHRCPQAGPDPAWCRLRD